MTTYGGLEIPGELALASDGGTLDARYTGFVAASLIGEGDGAIGIRIEQTTSIDASEVASLGFVEQGSEDFEHFELRFSLRLYRDGRFEGSVRLIGRRPNDCSEEIAAGEQCGSNEALTLYQGDFVP